MTQLFMRPFLCDQATNFQLLCGRTTNLKPFCVRPAPVNQILIRWSRDRVPELHLFLALLIFIFIDSTLYKTQTELSVISIEQTLLNRARTPPLASFPKHE